MNYTTFIEFNFDVDHASDLDTVIAVKVSAPSKDQRKDRPESPPAAAPSRVNLLRAGTVVEGPLLLLPADLAHQREERFVDVVPQGCRRFVKRTPKLLRQGFAFLG